MLHRRMPAEETERRCQLARERADRLEGWDLSNVSPTSLSALSDAGNQAPHPSRNRLGRRPRARDRSRVPGIPRTHVETDYHDGQEQEIGRVFPESPEPCRDESRVPGIRVSRKSPGIRARNSYLFLDFLRRRSANPARPAPTSPSVQGSGTTPPRSPRSMYVRNAKSPRCWVHLVSLVEPRYI